MTEKETQEFLKMYERRWGSYGMTNNRYDQLRALCNDDQLFVKMLFVFDSTCDACGKDTSELMCYCMRDD